MKRILFLLCAFCVSCTDSDFSKIYDGVTTKIAMNCYSGFSKKECLAAVDKNCKNAQVYWVDILSDGAIFIKATCQE